MSLPGGIRPVEYFFETDLVGIRFACRYVNICAFWHRVCYDVGCQE